ncbi:MAG: CocE/NonD family hydrolase, partial [Steroidobacteraceae bacterium]
MPTHTVTVSAVSIQMRDGVMLSGALHQPAETGQRPGILIANGYGADVEPFLARTIDILARRGYVVLLARLRGLPPSEGKAGLYEGFGKDTYDLIEWLARQPGCNGRIGLMGASLLGLVQYLGAKEAPPSLEAILPDDAGSDNYWYLWYPGGMKPGPGRAARQPVRGAESEYPLALAHPNYDAFWRERTMQPE